MGRLSEARVNTAIDQNKDLLTGCVAALDILGFKGIWQRHPPEVIVKVFSDLETSLAQVFTAPTRELIPIPALGTDGMPSGLERDNQGRLLLSEIIQHPYQFSFAIISDTVILAIASQYQLDYNPPLLLSQVVRLVQNHFLRSKIRALSRGYMCMGKYAIRGNLVFGPAIDEVAEAYELTRAACIWCSPELSKTFQAIKSGRKGATTEEDLEMKRSFLLESAAFVPNIELQLKDGSTIEAVVVNPYIRKFSAVRNAVERSFASAPVNVRTNAKRLATNHFLDAVEHRLRCLYENSEMREMPPLDQSHTAFKRRMFRWEASGKARVVRRVTFTQSGTEVVEYEKYR